MMDSTEPNSGDPSELGAQGAPSDQVAVERIIAEYIQANESGRPLDKQALLRQYPEHAQNLQEFFDFHENWSAASGGTQVLHFDGSTPSANTLSARAASIRAEADSVRSRTESSISSNPPQELGEYEILGEIDRGGMGVVYKARHKKLGRIVALKLIRSGELASQDEIDRFLSEAEAAAALSHPGIVPIYEVGTLQGLVFYTMSYIEGKSLADLMADGPLDPLEAVRIVHKLCGAVQYAHQAGIYHRDLKPANVLINADGQPIIIDFGLAKMAYRDSSLTVTGQILGTPAYMAPEHASGQSRGIGPGGDVYSLGAILYSLCAGQPAFSGSTPFDVLLQVLDRRPPAPSKLSKKVSRDLDYVCLHALEKEPQNRYLSARELADDLQRILTGDAIDQPEESAAQWFHKWWQREPLLVAHAIGIGGTTGIVAIAYVVRGVESPAFPFRMMLLVTWLLASFVLQNWVYWAAWRNVAILTWLAIDVTLFTSLITFAEPPRSMLLIGYPMMVVASGLFYQRRFVATTTALSIAGFFLLGWRFPKDDFVKHEFSAIFICGLIVISICVVAMIRRIRGLSRFYEDAPD